MQQLGTVSLYFDTRHRLANGKFMVKVRITFNENGKWQQKYISTGESCTQAEWEKILDGSVRGEIRTAYVNINNKLSEVQKANETATTFDELVAILDGVDIGAGREDFIAFAFDELYKMDGIIKPKTYKGYINRLEQLKKYRDVLPFKDIDGEFLAELKRHLLVDKKRKLNGIYQDFATVKKFVLIALKKGKMKSNPFESFKLSKEETFREWHTQEELKKLHALLGCEPLVFNGIKRKDVEGRITDAEKKTLRQYLFCCFTGLRFGDKKTFGGINVRDGRIHLKTAKRGRYVQIPLNGPALELLPGVLEHKLQPSNSIVNKNLRNCCKAAGIDKHVSYHSSRHTFAVNCLLLGIDIITVRDWLGHRSVTTTEVYAKIAAQHKDKSMEKFKGFV